MTKTAIFEKVTKFLRIANRKELECAEKYGHIADIGPEEIEILGSGWVSEYKLYSGAKIYKN